MHDPVDLETQDEGEQEEGSFERSRGFQRWIQAFYQVRQVHAVRAHRPTPNLHLEVRNGFQALQVHLLRAEPSSLLLQEAVERYGKDEAHWILRHLEADEGE